MIIALENVMNGTCCLSNLLSAQMDVRESIRTANGKE